MDEHNRRQPLQAVQSVYVQIPPVNIAPGQMPPFFATAVKSPLDKTPPGQTSRPVKRPSHTRKWQREHV